MKNRLKQMNNRQTWKRLTIGIVVLLVIVGVFYFLKTMNRVQIDDSLISAPVTVIAPTTPGTLTQVLVNEGQQVTKGQALAVVGSQTLRAYTDGVVVSTNKQIGGLMSPQTPVVQMVDLSQMRVDGTLDENKGLDQIKPGEPVSFTVDALPGTTFWGYVDEVSPTAKTTQAAFTISSERPTQQFDVYAHFDAANHPEIKNGMSAKMTVFTND